MSWPNAYFLILVVTCISLALNFRGKVLDPPPRNEGNRTPRHLHMLTFAPGQRCQVWGRALTILKSWYRKYCFTATNNHTVAPLDICTCSILGKGARSSVAPPPVLFDNSQRMAARANSNCEVVLFSTSTHSEEGGRSDLWQNNWVSLENLQPTLQQAH